MLLQQQSLRHQLQQHQGTNSKTFCVRWGTQKANAKMAKQYLLQLAFLHAMVTSQTSTQYSEK